MKGTPIPMFQGERFSRLVVLVVISKVQVLCRCDCESEIYATAQNLRSGNTKSCGCLRREIGRKKRANLLGKTSYRLTVMAFAYCKRNQVYWDCQCICGKMTTLSSHQIICGVVKSCGCWKREADKSPRKNLIGERFDRLVVMAIAPRVENKLEYLCRCDCGNDLVVPRCRLQTGNTKSCGCLKREMDAARRLSPGLRQATNNRYAHNWRVRKRNLPSDFTMKHFAFMMKYWKYQCAICGNQEGFHWTIAMDHWIPVASPGCPGTIIENMLPLCHGRKGVSITGVTCCNGSKWNKDPTIWLTARLGPRKAKAKLKEIERYFAAARTFAESLPTT